MIFSILFYIVECETSNDLTEREKEKKKEQKVSFHYRYGGKL